MEFSTLYLSTPEMTAFVLLGLGLTAAVAFQTLSRLNYGYLCTLPKESAIDSIMDVADDIMMEGIANKLELLCDKSGVPLPNGPDVILYVMFNANQGYEEILFSYHDLLAHGLMSSTYSYAMDVMAVMQIDGLAF